MMGKGNSSQLRNLFLREPKKKKEGSKKAEPCWRSRGSVCNLRQKGGGGGGKSPCWKMLDSTNFCEKKGGKGGQFLRLKKKLGGGWVWGYSHTQKRGKAHPQERKCVGGSTRRIGLGGG